MSGMEAIDLEEGEIAGESSCLPENALEEEVWAALKTLHTRLALLSVCQSGFMHSITTTMGMHGVPWCCRCMTVVRALHSQHKPPPRRPPSHGRSGGCKSWPQQLCLPWAASSMCTALM